MAIAVVGPVLAPGIVRALNLKLVVVPSRWKVVGNRHPIGNEMDSLGELERSDGNLPVNEVVSAGETTSEECPRLFGHEA